MRILCSVRALGVLAAAFLAACSSGSQPATVTPGTGSGGVNAMVRTLTVNTSTAVHGLAVTGRHGKSWIAADAKRAPRLLFVSLASNEVDIFTLPALALKGQIAIGFNQPGGMCSDASGNIWITSTEGGYIAQYSRTGTLLNTLSDPGDPSGCAVNKKTGDLAVSNYDTGKGGSSGGYYAGNVEVYTHASGRPTAYSNPAQYVYLSVGYDPSGDLFTDGETASRVPILSELPSGSGSMRTISISGGTIYGPGIVQWYNAGNDLVVGDFRCGDASASCLYQITVAGSAGTIIATTNLKTYKGGPGCVMFQSEIAANGQSYVAGGCGEDHTVDRWAFPAGGKPTNYNATIKTLWPLGSAVSVK